MRALAVLAGLALLLGAGCASTPAAPPAPSRPFDFARDVFAFENELYWIYEFSEDAELVSHQRRENVENGQRCGAMIRVARQFFQHARFEPGQPRTDATRYAELIGRVVATDPREQLAAGERIPIPGYPDLRAFSAEWGPLLQDHLGGAWRSYVQRGNWRMVYPFAPRQQRATAAEILSDLERGELPIMRVVTFPRVKINHTVLVFAAQSTPTHIVFSTYDPNDNQTPVELTFERASATFSFEKRDYFAGGAVNAYEIYDGFLY